MYKKLDEYSYRLILKLENLNARSSTNIDIKKIKKAIEVAKKYHATQERNSGEPFYSHPIAVAEMVADYCFDTDTISTAILHDIIEDTDATIEMIEFLFGDNVAIMVEGLTRIKSYGKKVTIDELINDLVNKKMINALLVKLFDRVHNMQTINSKPPQRQKQIANETLIEFIQLADYLKVPIIERKLQILCSNIFEKLN